MFLFYLQAEDLIDDLLSLESSSLASDSFKTSDNSLTSADINIKNEPLIYTEAELHAIAKDRQKKDNHNMSEYALENFYYPNFILFYYITF